MNKKANQEKNYYFIPNHFIKNNSEGLNPNSWKFYAESSKVNSQDFFGIKAELDSGIWCFLGKWKGISMDIRKTGLSA